MARKRGKFIPAKKKRRLPIFVALAAICAVVLAVVGITTLSPSENNSEHDGAFANQENTVRAPADSNATPTAYVKTIPGDYNPDADI